MTPKRVFTFTGLFVAATLTFFSLENAGVTAPPSGRARPDTGEISGRVTFEGTAPRVQEIDMSKDPVCVTRHKTPVHIPDGRVNGNGTLPNVFVYVKAGTENQKFETPSNPVILNQEGCQYSPHVLGIMISQPLEIVSSDATTHNIHAMPKDNPEWNHSQTPGASPLRARFTHAEVMIPVKCNEHPWMRAYIGVVSNPFFAVSDNEGKFVIHNVPPGEYTLGAWTATFGTRDQKVTVAAGQKAAVDFVFHAP